MKTIPVIDATAPGAVVGRHAIWLPDLQVKVPFQWGGLITKYHRHEDGTAPVATLPHELAILRALAAEGMAPTIGELVYIETLISEHPGAWHADPTGAWGYEMADATKLPPGRFSVERMRQLPISGSPGAWNDIEVPGRDNVVNGYLVDVRRSAWDMLQWTGPLGACPKREWQPEELRERVHRECQFPRGARSVAYQDFWLGGELNRGQRRVEERAEAMGFLPLQADTVLDIGCQAGGFLQYAWRRDVRRIAGVDIDANYIDCARAIARSCGQNICYRQMDVTREREAFLAWVRAYFPDGVDHLLCLSMEKHLDIWPLIDAIGARRTYVETNAVTSESDLKLLPQVKVRGGRHVGFSRDRNLRALYQIGDTK